MGCHIDDASRGASEASWSSATLAAVAEDLWRDVACAFDRSFATLCAGTISALIERVPEPSRVVDVGCGAGHLTAALVAAGHEVTAVDPDPQMLALTRGRVAVEALAGGLPDLPVPQEAADVVVANFVLNHVDDPRRAAIGLTRAIRPGGRAIATIWPGRSQPQAMLWNSLLDEAGAVRPELPRLAPELDFERTPEGLAGILEGIGLAVTTAEPVGWTWRVGSEDLWVGLTSVGNFGVTWRAQDDVTRRRVRVAYDEAVAGSQEVLEFDVEAILVEAVGADA